MRISANPKDPDYNVALLNIVVLLDGVCMRRVIEADDVAGRVVRIAVDSEGLFMQDEEKPDQMKTEELHGNVVFKQGMPWPPA